MNDDNRPEEQASHSVSEESGSSQQSQETQQNGQPEYSAVSQVQGQTQAQSQSQVSQAAESGSQYEPQSAYRVLQSLTQPQQQPSQAQPQSPTQPYPQPYGAQSGTQPQTQPQTQQYSSVQPEQQHCSGSPASQVSQPQQYQGQQGPQSQLYQQPQDQSQSGYQQAQYQPYRAQPQYQQPTQYSSPQYPSAQYQPYPPQLGAQPRYQPYQTQPQYQPGIGYQYPSQPQHMQQPPSQFARPASRSYFYQPNPAWQAAMTRWLHAVRQRFSNLGFALDLVILVWYAVTIVIEGIVLQFVSFAKLPMWAQLLMSNGPLYAIAIPLSLLVFRTIPKVKRKTSNMSVGMFLSLMAISFPLADIGNFIGNIFSSMLSNNQAESNIDELIERLDPISILLFTVIIAPIFEEWLFRRLLIDRMQQYGEKTAILVSALAFGLFHGNLFQFFYAFGFGLLLAYAYVRTGKLRYTIAMHMTFNFFGGFLPQATLLMMSKSVRNMVSADMFGGISQAFATNHGREVTPFLMYLVFDGVMFILGIVVAIVERKELVFYKAPEELPRGTRARTVLGNPGVIIFIVLSVLLMIAALFNV